MGPLPAALGHGLPQPTQHTHSTARSGRVGGGLAEGCAATAAGISVGPSVVILAYLQGEEYIVMESHRARGINTQLKAGAT